jgi:hypothetical protein
MAARLSALRAGLPLPLGKFLVLAFEILIYLRYTHETDPINMTYSLSTVLITHT